jgi:hypothetical protein
VHDRICVGLGECRPDLGWVLQVTVDKGGARFECGPVPLSQVVENGDLVACIEELFHANTSDVAGSASDKNVHIIKKRDWMILQLLVRAQSGKRAEREGNLNCLKSRLAGILLTL